MDSECSSPLATSSTRREDLIHQRKVLEEECHRLDLEIAEIEAAVRILDPQNLLSLGKHRARPRRPSNAPSKRFIMRCLNNASGPMTPVELAVTLCVKRRNAVNQSDLSLLRKKIEATLEILLQQGAVQRANLAGGITTWNICKPRR